MSEEKPNALAMLNELEAEGGLSSWRAAKLNDIRFALLAERAEHAREAARLESQLRGYQRRERVLASGLVKAGEQLSARPAVECPFDSPVAKEGES